MAVKRPAKLQVILNPDDTRKLILPDGIPESMEQLMDEVRKVCGLSGNLRLQYQDRDLLVNRDALVNLTSTAEGEANHIPDIPTGETPEKLENERLSLLTEAKKCNNRAVIKAKMDKTFSLRREDILAKESEVEELKERWPALFTMDEINAEFMRITTVPLQPRFLASQHHSKLIEIIRNKGGVVREKTRNTLNVLDQSLDVNQKRECLLKCLIVYLGEDVDKLIKEYRVVQKYEAQTELERSTMAVFVFREDEDPLQPPHDIGIVIEGVQVLHELPSVPHACAMLFGLIYALNLSYPSEHKYTFDALQKIFMEILPKKLVR
ncbi:uncharacterized protein LOC116694379 [Etheostoma spectabile]|uniref:uncharacterized protein LOC116694379 n=1 Tax=Etheostoma spectabile TaxID=54343 RepID=UPI0013AF8208|nr:uncharacterized protein LOC116694379 [Etheostoma spectabile]XP_032379999.1 uncharacterized protein LOC116694379 [Etheostoma spectabile]